MRTSTVNIAFHPVLLEEIDRVAGAESRARSDLIREAARMYIARKKQWERILAFGARQARELGLKPGDVASAIRQFRRQRARGHRE